jgi:ribosomal protein S18 acetylase RimI-like enzyme
MHELEDAIQVFMSSFRRTDDESLYELTKNHWTNWQKSKLASFYGAFQDSILVGICLSFPFKTTATLGYMCVDYRYQNQGIGSSLLNHIINELDGQGIHTIRLYATKIGENLYKKYGFTEDFIGSIFGLDFREDISKRELRVRTSNRILPWIYSLDKAVYGDDRTKFLRYLIKNGQLIVKARSGFAFVRGEKIGPVIAKNIPVFIDLLKYAYTLGGRKIYYLTHNPHSHKIIEVLHLVENTAMRCKRMVRGEKIKEDLSNFYALYNFSIG